MIPNTQKYHYYGFYWGGGLETLQFLCDYMALITLDGKVSVLIKIMEKRVQQF